jgi:uncharacterized protein YbbC (DUF1343 family)
MNRTFKFNYIVIVALLITLFLPGCALFIPDLEEAVEDEPEIVNEDAEKENIPEEENATVELEEEDFKLGSEVLMEKERHLLHGKRVGLVTNQSGVNSDGKSTINLFSEAEDINLVALYGPEHGIDGLAAAGEYVESYIHELLAIPVYSLYGATRMPTEEMLADIDILVYDIQDIGARSYTYISTLNYCMIAARNSGLPVVVLDRPNPLGGIIVDGPVLEERYKSFVGIDLLPEAHGMTVGEIALFLIETSGSI